jgi:hypothetical protein
MRPTGITSVTGRITVMRRNHTARFVGLTGLIGVAVLAAALAFTTSDEIVYQVNTRLNGVDQAAVDPCSSDPSDKEVYYVNDPKDSGDKTAMDSCSDQVEGCTLRAAIKLANTKDDKKHTIQLYGDTFTLTIANAMPYEDENNGERGDLDIDVAKCLTIVGYGHFSPTIIHAGGDGGVRDRVLDVRQRSTVVLRGLTIRGGWVQGSGGGIRNEGNLTLRDVSVVNNTTLEANSGGGIYNKGTGRSDGRATLTLEHSGVAANTAGWNPSRTFAASGGGITNEHGDVTIRYGLVVYNRAGYYGGGILVGSTDATVLLENSTVSENEAPYGAGLSNWGKLQLAGSTVSSNIALYCSGTAIYHNSAQTLSFLSSTIARNDGPGCSTGGTRPLAAVYLNDGTAEFRNSIIDQGSAGCAGTASARFRSGGYNIDSGLSCGLNAASDHSNTDPKLGDLIRNGGPTFTHAVLAGPAVDAIPGPAGNGSPKTDQRNAPRFGDHHGGNVANIGSYEDAGMTVRELTPAAVRREYLPATIKVGGEGFGPLTVVWFNGSLRRTTVKNSTELEFEPTVRWRGPLTSGLLKVANTEQAISPTTPGPGIHWVSLIDLGRNLSSNGQPLYVY